MIRVCSEHDVPEGEGRVVTIDGRRIALFRTATGWYAIDDACPHAGGPLADGIAADCTVICPIHERRFRLDTGEPVAHEGPSVTTHRVELDGDDVWIELAGSLVPAV